MLILTFKAWSATHNRPKIGTKLLLHFYGGGTMDMAMHCSPFPVTKSIHDSW